MITLLLQHDPDKRPSALELSHSDLLPPRVADEFFKETLSVMSACPCESAMNGSSRAS